MHPVMSEPPRDPHARSQQTPFVPARRQRRSRYTTEELPDHLRASEDEPLDWSDMLRKREAEVHVHIPEHRPEDRAQVVPRVLEDVLPLVPTKDRGGGSSCSISPAPSPIGPREIKMSYPSPMPSPTSSLGQSWLSSHHSDDHFFIPESTPSLGCTFGSRVRRDFWHLALEDFRGIAFTALDGRDETATISNSINHVRRDSAWPRNTTSEPPVLIG